MAGSCACSRRRRHGCGRLAVEWRCARRPVLHAVGRRDGVDDVCEDLGRHRRVGLVRRSGPGPGVHESLVDPLDDSPPPGGARRLDRRAGGEPHGGSRRAGHRSRRCQDRSLGNHGSRRFTCRVGGCGRYRHADLPARVLEPSRHGGGAAGIVLGARGVGTGQGRDRLGEWPLRLVRDWPWPRCAGSLVWRHDWISWSWSLLLLALRAGGRRDGVSDHGWCLRSACR